MTSERRAEARFSDKTLSRAARDLVAVVTGSYPWRALAWADVRSKYRRTHLGPFWITLSTGSLALAVGTFYSQFFGQEIGTYLPYFTTGMVIWYFISSVVSEGTTVLANAASYIKSSTMPLSFHVMRMVHRNCIIFLHNLIIVVLLWLVFRWSLSASALLAVAGFLLLYVFAAALSVIISFICVRYRDVPPVVTAVLQFVFFASPIFWYPETLKVGRVLLWLNPVTHFLAIIRDPLLGRAFGGENWLIAGGVTGATLLVAAKIYLSYRDRVAYWV